MIYKNVVSKITLNSFNLTTKKYHDQKFKKIILSFPSLYYTITKK